MFLLPKQKAITAKNKTSKESGAPLTTGGASSKAYMAAAPSRIKIILNVYIFYLRRSGKEYSE